MRLPTPNTPSPHQRLRHAFLIVSLFILTTLSCSLPRTLFETFVSPSDLDREAVATWEEKYAEEDGLELVEDDPTEAAPEMTENDSPDQARQLTPQELANEGTHFYRMTGETTPMLGNDGTINDSGFCSSEFTAEGVNFQLKTYQAGFFSRTADNQYEQLTEAGTRITLEYTNTGILYDSLQENGNFLDMVLTRDD